MVETLELEAEEMQYTLTPRMQQSIILVSDINFHSNQLT